jgi:hypothetical protein
MFKEKTSKKRIVTNNKDNSTVDVMHNKMITNFVSKNREKDYYNLQLIELLQIQNIIKSNIEIVQNNSEILNDLWTSNIKLLEEIVNIKNKIKIIEDYDEIEYYTTTSDILFQYYDMLEKQSYIKNTNITNIKNTNKTILDALNSTSVTNKIEYTSNHANVIDELSVDKSALVDEYLCMTNKQHIKKTNNEDLEVCKKCKTQMICLQHDAIMICNQCGYQELLLVEQNRPILKHNNKDTSHFSYKRINHFREWCNQVQGKESTDIPDSIFEKILNEIKKEKIIDTKTITYSKMREILKRLRINKYYEHINYIINRINGIPTPQFSPDLEEKLCNMFRDIQGPFLKHCPKDRKNFLSYSYVLYKFFQILGLHEHLKHFPLLKSREKLYVQDQIWKKICEELNYEFIPSPSL